MTGMTTAGYFEPWDLLAEHNNVVKALGSNRSAVRHIRFAMGSAAVSAGHECLLIEVFG
jgi:hypothetical protein